MDQWTDQRTDKRTDQRTKGPTDESTYERVYVCTTCRDWVDVWKSEFVEGFPKTVRLLTYRAGILDEVRGDQKQE